MADLSLDKMGGVKTVPMHGKAGGTYAVDMVLTLTGSKELGFGASGGSPAFGNVTSVGGSATDIVLNVQTAGFTETVKMTSTAANRPTVGMPPYCNDKGELVKAPEILMGVPCGVIVATDTTKNTATVRWF